MIVGRQFADAHQELLATAIRGRARIAPHPELDDRNRLTSLRAFAWARLVVADRAYRSEHQQMICKIRRSWMLFIHSVRRNTQHPVLCDRFDEQPFMRPPRILGAG